MSKLTTRLHKLEQQHGRVMDFIILYFDEGIATGEHNGNKHPELIGMTEAEIEARYSGREDVLVIKIVYASQDPAVVDRKPNNY